MCGKTRPLIGLKHPVAEGVRFGQGEVGRHLGRVHILELGMGRRIAVRVSWRAPDPYQISAIHCAVVPFQQEPSMDGGDLVGVWCTPTHPDCDPPPHAQFQYVNSSEVAPYFTLAETYTFGDRMFQTNQGPSFPAHLNIIAGTSAI